MRSLLLLLAGLVAVAVVNSRRSDSDFAYGDEEINVDRFKPGMEYRFHYNTQISSGIDGLSSQRAVTRLQTTVRMTVTDSRRIFMRLENVRIGALNADVEKPQRVQPFDLFEEQSIDEQKLAELQMPAQFDYQQGVIGKIVFDGQDQAWSKNIKKAILNMLQAKLNKRTTTDMDDDRDTDSEDFEGMSQLNDKDGDKKLFTVTETMLEGKCPAIYSIEETNDGEKKRSNKAGWSVTKSIAFANCTRMADIRYGRSLEKPCSRCVEQKLLEKQLQRSTVVEMEMLGEQRTGNFLVKRATLLSHYVYKTFGAVANEQQTMSTIVAGELRLVQTTKRTADSSRDDHRIRGEREETLLYSNEWDKEERRFFMHGDEDFGGAETPFSRVHDKTGIAAQIMRRMLQSSADKTVGIDADSTLQLGRLVEILRMCTVKELKHIHSQIHGTGASASDRDEKFSQTEQTRARDLLFDALAIAATRNTIHVLVEKIQNGEITPAKAGQMLKSLSALPTPSDKQIEPVERLCKSEIVMRSAALRQSCWLTLGSMVGELCRPRPEDIYTAGNTNDNNDDTEKSTISQEKICPRHTKDKYVKSLMTMYRSADSSYEKVLALKAIGNAGIDVAVFDLEKIIVDARESKVVRMQAIDALRRLRNVMPRKIQRVLLPLFANGREHPEVRMAAFAMLMHTVPEKALLDQIAYVLVNDRSAHVKAFVYTTSMTLAQSPLPIEKQLGDELKTVIKMARIDIDDVMRAKSVFVRVPIYSEASEEGVLVDWLSIFSSQGMLPKQLSAKLHSVMNGVLEKNTVELTFVQENLEQWYEKLMDWYRGNTDNDQESQGQQQKQRQTLRGERGQRREEGDSSSSSSMRSIFDTLKIKNRRHGGGDNDNYNDNEQTPFAAIYLRYRDIDYALVPLEERSMPELFKKLLGGEKPSLSHYGAGGLFDERHMHYQTAVTFGECRHMVPTSAGMPLRIDHLTPLIASVEGQYKLRFESDRVDRPLAVRATLKAHPRLTVTHIVKCEVWSPIVNSGVETLRSVELNLPLNAEIDTATGQSKALKIKLTVPEQKTRLVSLRTLPITFSRKWNAKTRLHSEPLVKTIHADNKKCSRIVEIEKMFGERNFGLPLRVSGHCQMPTTMTTSYKNIVSALMTGDNHIDVTFEPSGETPRELHFTLETSTFEKLESRSQPELDHFYAFENGQLMENEAESRDKLRRYLREYSPSRMYKHGVKATVESIGGVRAAKASAELETACDSEMRFCKAVVEARRHSDDDWRFYSKIQTLRPERSYSEERVRDSRQPKFICLAETKWGSSGSEQHVNVHIHGESDKSNNKGMDNENDDEQTSMSSYGYSQKNIDDESSSTKKGSFLNKFNVNVNYRLTKGGENYAQQLFNLFKAWTWMKTDAELKSGRDNVVSALIKINPTTRKHVDITIQTPTERLQQKGVLLPIALPTFSLVRRHADSSVDSVGELFSSYVRDQRAECQVDGRQVRTFDEVVYKAPLSTCYSVLAKDCGRDQPRFVVLMKNAQSGSEEKKLKVIVDEQTIEIEPSRNSNNKKLNVLIDGRRIENEEQLEGYGVRFDDDEMVQIDASGVTVRFDGRKAWLSLSPLYKNTQCGICGHYDNEQDDELRQADNSLTDDVRDFHRSYSLRNAECDDDQQKTYGEQKFRLESSNEQDSDEIDNTNRRRDNANDNDDDANEIAPIEKTEVIEYSHEICFSVSPVKKCPEGSRPQRTHETKPHFACVRRSSLEARKLQREARNNIVDMSAYSPSFVETIRVPVKCIEY